MASKNILLNAAVAGIFATGTVGVIGTVGCANKSTSGGGGNEASKQPWEMGLEKHACAGLNSCEGKGGCKAGDNGCAGKNTCAGKGGCATVAHHACTGHNECKGLGGCKTGDNGCQAKNSCNGQGGCAVPLKALNN